MTEITDTQVDGWIAMARDKAARYGVTIATGDFDPVVNRDTRRWRPDGSGQCDLIGTFVLGELAVADSDDPRHYCALHTAARVMGLSFDEAIDVSLGFGGATDWRGHETNISAYLAGMKAREALLGSGIDQRDNDKRRLAYRFLALPFRHQIAVASALDVLTDADPAFSDEALFRVLFRRAADNGILGTLWAETEKRHDDPMHSNPFQYSP